MTEQRKSFIEASNEIAFIVNHKCSDNSETKLIKKKVQGSYGAIATMFFDSVFYNFGLWNKEIYNEYQGLNFNISTLCSQQDIYSALLLYYLIRPLVKTNCFEKRLLEVGCGNGIGLKMGSELLKTNYALGIDLVNEMVAHANRNFYKKNKVNYVQSDAEKLPLENESFDIITSLESSHLYPSIEHFFSEVERVLSVGGFFCYSDFNLNGKQPGKKVEAFLKTKNNLKIIQKHNITRMVQSSIYQRLIVNEDGFYSFAKSFFDNDERKLLMEFPAFIMTCGLAFLPWWKIRFKNLELRNVAKNARKNNFWTKKDYFYFLIQKVGK